MADHPPATLNGVVTPKVIALTSQPTAHPREGRVAPAPAAVSAAAGRPPHQQP